MLTNSSKRAFRIENKKKKMAALLEIKELNEYDRILKTQNSEKMKSLESKLVDTEPSSKKLKVNGNNIEKNPDLGPSGKPKLSGEEFKQLKKALREQSNLRKRQPSFYLREKGLNASLTVDIENRVPLFLSDIQHLIMYSQLGHYAPYSPARWCALDKFNRLVTTSVLIIEDISLYHFISNESMFPFLSSKFDTKVEILTPKECDIVKELSMVPLTGTQMKKVINEYGTLESAVTECGEIFDTFKHSFPIEQTNSNSNTNSEWPDNFPRTHLLLSGWQMIEENFPLPIRGLKERKYVGYVLTKDSYEEVTPWSPLFGVDCEMCITSTGDLELTRVSVVDEQLNTFYDTLVKPDNKITNYLTKFSGITEKMLRNVTKKLSDVQDDFRKLLPKDAILVGHSLSNDLHALKMMHPYVIDTSVIFNITGNRIRKTKLKTLAKEFLYEDIQIGRGHCSTEDSSASLKLAQLKLRKTLYYGDAVMGNIQDEIRAYHELGTTNYATSLLHQTTKHDNKSLVVGMNEISMKYKYYVDKNLNCVKENSKINCLSEESSKDVIKQMTNNIGNYSLIIGHIKESENSKTCKNIDGLIKEVYKKTSTPGLVLIVFGGFQNANGGCFIQAKTNF